MSPAGIHLISTRQVSGKMCFTCMRCQWYLSISSLVCFISSYLFIIVRFIVISSFLSHYNHPFNNPLFTISSSISFISCYSFVIILSIVLSSILFLHHLPFNNPLSSLLFIHSHCFVNNSLFFISSLRLSSFKLLPLQLIHLSAFPSFLLVLSIHSLLSISS